MAVAIPYTLFTDSRRTGRAQRLLQFLLHDQLDGALNPLPHQLFQRPFSLPSAPAIPLHGVILRHPPSSGCESWLNSPDLDAFSLFHQLPDTTLVRALIESSLKFAINKADMRKELLREFFAEARNKGKEPGLDFVIDFCLRHVAGIFSTNVSRILEVWKKTKTGADLVIHGDWARPNRLDLERAASNVAPLVVRILDGSALR